MSYIIYKTLNIALDNKINTYKDFLDIIISEQKKKYFNLSSIINIIINIFLLATFFIMISGFGVYFNQEFRNKQSYRFMCAKHNLFLLISRKY